MPDSAEENAFKDDAIEAIRLNLLDLIQADEPMAGATVDKQDVNKGDSLIKHEPRLTLEKASEIMQFRQDWTRDAFNEFVRGMSEQDQWVADKLYRDGGELTEKRLTELQQDASNVVLLRQHLQKHARLATLFHMNETSLIRVFGIRPVQEFANFMSLFDRVGRKTSPYPAFIGPETELIFKLAQSPIRSLPDSIIKEIIRLDLERIHNLTGERVGAIERLIPCTKAWSLSPTLPKAVAERIGAMPVLNRMAAAVAWKETANDKPIEGIVAEGGNRSETIDRFWNSYAQLMAKGRDAILVGYGGVSSSFDRQFHAKAVRRLTVEVLPELSWPVQRSLATVLCDYRIEGMNPAEILLGVNKNVLARAMSDHVGDCSTPLKLSLIFQDTKQFENFRLHGDKDHVRDLLSSTYRANAKDWSGLAERFQSLIDKASKTTAASDEARLILKHWPLLTDAQKQLSDQELDAIIKTAQELSSERVFNAYWYSRADLATTLKLIDRYRDLPMQEMRVLAKAVLKQPGLLEKLDGEMLPHALKAWQIEATLPQEIAAVVGKKDLWRIAAAKIAWNKLSESDTDKGDPASTLNRFFTSMEQVESTGKYRVLMKNGDPYLATRSMFPTIEPLYQFTLAKVASGISGANENPVEKIVGMQCGAFRDALKFLDPLLASKVVVPLDTYFGSARQGRDNNEAVNGWEPQAAYGLVATFGKEWKQWLALMERQGVDAHDASFWLPLRSPGELIGLKEWLFRNKDRERKYLAIVANRWSELKVDEKELPFNKLIDLITSMKYMNARNREFALENARWSVPESEFTWREHRFLATLSTPSPFPLDKRWESGNLVGYFLPRSDPRGLYLGQHTGCCQHPDGQARTSAWHGQESPDGGFFVVVSKDRPGEILAGSWAWVSDDGGMCFDSIESINVMKNGQEILNVYKSAASDLAASRFHTVTVTKSSKFSALGDETAYLEAAGARSLHLPSNYSGYSDMKDGNQVLLAFDEQLPRRVDVDKQTWVRASASFGNTPLIDGYRLSKADLGLVLQNRKSGQIGHAVLNQSRRELQSLNVRSDHLSDCEVLLKAVLVPVRELGGQWICAAQESSSLPLLRLAESKGLIRILASEPGGESKGEAVHIVKFEAAPVRRIDTINNTADQGNALQAKGPDVNLEEKEIALVRRLLGGEADVKGWTSEELADCLRSRAGVAKLKGELGLQENQIVEKLCEELRKGDPRCLRLLGTMDAVDSHATTGVFAVRNQTTATLPLSTNPYNNNVDSGWMGLRQRSSFPRIPIELKSTAREKDLSLNAARFRPPGGSTGAHVQNVIGKTTFYLMAASTAIDLYDELESLFKEEK